MLRAPFSLEKITWNESTGKVIYRSSRSWHTCCRSMDLVQTPSKVIRWM